MVVNTFCTGPEGPFLLPVTWKEPSTLPDLGGMRLVGSGEPLQQACGPDFLCSSRLPPDLSANARAKAKGLLIRLPGTRPPNDVWLHPGGGAIAIVSLPFSFWQGGGAARSQRSAPDTLLPSAGSEQAEPNPRALACCLQSRGSRQLPKRMWVQPGQVTCMTRPGQGLGWSRSPTDIPPPPLQLSFLGLSRYRCGYSDGRHTPLLPATL